MIALKLTSVGSSTGVELPEEALARLKVQKGDTIYLAEGPDGCFRLSALDPEEFSRRLKSIKQVMHDDRNILAALAE